MSSPQVSLDPARTGRPPSASACRARAASAVEPFRPFVDVLAWPTAGDGAPCRDGLSVEDRRAMASCLLGQARLGDETVTLLTASERTAESLVRAIEAATPAVLTLPALILPGPAP